jgi:DamX protein
VLLNQAKDAGKLLVTFSGVTPVGQSSSSQADNNGKQSLQTDNVNKPALAAVTTAVKPIVAVKPQQVVVESKPITKPVTVAAVQQPVVQPVAPAPAKKVAPVVTKPVLAVSQQHELKLPMTTTAPVVKTAAVASQAAAATTKQGGYTIQLTTDRQLASVQGFIAENKLQDKATYIQSKTKQGDALYIGIYGQYATRAAAQQALEALPEAVKSEGAYVVSSNSLHSDSATKTSQNVAANTAKNETADNS